MPRTRNWRVTEIRGFLTIGCSGVEVAPAILPIASFVGIHPILSRLHGVCILPKLPCVLKKGLISQWTARVARSRASNGCVNTLLKPFASILNFKLERSRSPNNYCGAATGPAASSFACTVRAVKFSAIWVSEQNQVLFYGSAGQRIEKIRLAGALSVG